MTSPGTPYAGGRVVVIDDEPGPDGFAAVCTPHGPLGAWGSRTEAFLRALEHDHAHGGMSAQ
jgi:hypothetical protein